MSANPYFIEGPAVISFSGGRTSAFMLRQILIAHSGKLPEDVLVIFTNTGKEREETLRFVHDCATLWSVPIIWLEYRPEGFEQVGFNSASRCGEPFEALIDKKGYLPNAVTRFCTSELKVRPIKKFVMSLGWRNWSNVIGLRYDEGMRVMRQLAANMQGKDRWKAVMPMSRAHHVKSDVMHFWFGERYSPAKMRELILLPNSDLPQGFDLRLLDHEGNCDLCMLKAREAKKQIIRERPGSVDWWKDREASISMRSKRATEAGRRFVTEYSYADLEREVLTQSTIFDIAQWSDEHDVECGLLCGAEEVGA